MGSEKDDILSAGKVAPELLERLIKKVFGRARKGSDVVIGPSIGIDAAVLRLSGRYIAVSSDPITLASDLAAYYCVNVNANDIAVMGAQPQYMTVVLILPEGVKVGVLYKIASDLKRYSKRLKIKIIGGHSEVSSTVNAPIMVATIIGRLLNPRRIISSATAKAGDLVIMSKFAGIEGTAIIAREKREYLLSKGIEEAYIKRASNWLFKPGISIVKEAELAIRFGASGMHDATEGGIITALWEFAKASRLSLEVDLDKIKVHPITSRLCGVFDIDPLRLISSGCLLISISPKRADKLISALRERKIDATIIGEFRRAREGIFDKKDARRIKPSSDEIVKIYG